MEHKLLVPVRTTAAGTLALRTGRLSSGERTGLAFTSQDALVRALGPSQQWTDLSWEALLDMVAPLGIEHIRVDPEPDRRPRTGHSPQPPRSLPGPVLTGRGPGKPASPGRTPVAEALRPARAGDVRVSAKAASRIACTAFMRPGS